MLALGNALYGDIRHCLICESSDSGDNEAMLDTIAERIAYAIDNGPYSKAEIARACGVSPQSVTGWTKTGRITKENLYTLAQMTGFNPEWIATGKGPQRIDVSAFQPVKLLSEPGIIGRVPLISWVQAGAFCEAIDLCQPGDAEEWMPCPTNHGPSTFALRVQGDSMISPYPTEKSYAPGTIIFVDPDRPVFNGAKVVARLPDSNEVTFKRYSEDAGRIYLVPLNSAYRTIEITAETHICGVVIGSYTEE